MKLFNELDPQENLLPFDGTLNYYGPIFFGNECLQTFNTLLYSLDWKHDEVHMFGKRIITKRKFVWMADDSFPYTYGKIKREASLWHPIVKEIKDKVEKISNEKYNSCLLNLYPSGEEGMGWHSDAEHELEANAAIASVSFEAVRKFALKHKKVEHKISLTLEDGSLLVMKDEIQTYWLHQLPKSKSITTPRINLTFRTIKKTF